MPTTATRRTVAWVLGVVAVFAVAGLGCGWLWASRFAAPSGVVYSHVWYPDPWDAGQRTVFAATGSYVVIALVAGVVLGILVSVISRGREVATLVAVSVGSAAAGLLMLRLGLHLAPSDPTKVAAEVADGTRLNGGLEAPGKAAWVAFPLAALVPLCVLYLMFQPRRQPDLSSQA